MEYVLKRAMKRRLLLLVAVVTLGSPFTGLLMFVEEVGAAEDLEKKQDLLKKTEEQIAVTKSVIELKKNQANILNNQIGTLEKRSDSLENDMRDNKTKIEQIGNDVRSLETRIESNESAVGIKKSILAGLFRSYYDFQSIDESAEMTETFGGDSFLGVRDNLESFQDEISKGLAEILELQGKLIDDKDKLRQNREQLEDFEEKLASQMTYLEGAQKQKEALLSQAQTEQKVYQKKLSRLEEERRDIESEIEDIESVKSGKIDLKSMPAPKKGLLGFPVSTPVRVTQNYGKATWTRWYSFHNGVDFGGKTGDSIFSAGNGKVVATGDNGRYAYGKWIAVDHANGITTMYGHLSAYEAKKGDSVKEGEIIGRLGNTGYSTGPHLHFTVFSSDSFEVVESKKVSGIKIPTGGHVNPNKYLK